MNLKSLNVPLLILVLLVALTGNSAWSQTCTGSLGDPVINIDFGRGPLRFGPSLGLGNNYTYDNSGMPGRPTDGQYSIAKTTTGMNGGWYTVNNHTPNDPDGYMMVVNASNDPGIFYESTSPINLCPNTTYEFAAWISNILRDLNGNRPNITFFILSMNNQVLRTFNTGNIPNGNSQWKQYGFLFQTTNVTQVKIRMVNNGPGGPGNDLALDDITFRACGPTITTKLNNSDDTEANICEGENASYTFSAEVNGSPTLKHQWQVSKDYGSWADIPNESTKSMSQTFSNAEKGIYRYRFTTAEPGNFNSVNCRTVSPTLTINVNPLPELTIADNILGCIGDNVTINLLSTGGSYAWTGPNGFTSTQKSPVIQNASMASRGVYKVVVTSLFNCVSVAQTTLNIIPRAVVTVGNANPAVCDGEAVQLSANGGQSYRWSPTAGLSDPNIANPIANPSQTTLYTVAVSNGTCETLAEVNVTVHKNPKAETGVDKKILRGNSIVIEGIPEGEDITYFWSPSNDLDDPNSLNPVASPKSDMTYTFNVVSNKGCVTATADIFIKVYEKVEVPSSFSPNGDGINDTWSIIAIDTFAEPKVRVVNRYGEKVFESYGYKIPWDGKYKGKDLPPGVYYYLIYLNTDLKPLSGSLTVIR